MRVPDFGEDGPFCRWMVTKGMGVEAFDGPVDLDMVMNWHAPAITSFVLNARSAGDPPKRGYGVCNMHLVTPETEISPHYFFKSVKGFGDPALTAQFMDGVQAIFAQDRPILEAQ